MSVAARILRLERKQPTITNEYANLSDEELAIQLVNVAAECLAIPNIEDSDAANCLTEIELVKDLCHSPGYFRQPEDVIGHLKVLGFWNA